LDITGSDCPIAGSFEYSLNSTIIQDEKLVDQLSDHQFLKQKSYAIFKSPSREFQAATAVLHLYCIREIPASYLGEKVS
jgi:hypothetical protein